MSTYIVSETAHMLKKAGLKANSSVHYKGANAHPAPKFPGVAVVTFGQLPTC